MKSLLLSDVDEREIEMEMCECGHPKHLHITVCYGNNCNCVKFTLDETTPNYDESEEN